MMTSVQGANLIECLVNVSEKAANIARVCRQDELLFQLLIQEKKHDEKNQRFIQDFKTLADVLIQEMVKHDIGALFPEIAPFIMGEESNSFSNALDETITVEPKSSIEETSALLCQVLDGNSAAAHRLATEVHRTVTIDQVNIGTSLLPTDISPMPLDQFGIWIDPIDSTGEYISGEGQASSYDGLHTRGLACVTVLIGVYDRRTGVPIIGVVNQPFHVLSQSVWHGKCQWGLHYKENASSSCGKIMPAPRENTLIALSGSEDPKLKKELTEAGYQLVEVAGAGYKLLCVAIGIVDIYLLSKGTTYRWDTCAPHALLRALGGDIITYKDGISITYQQTEKGKGWCNKDGLLACRDLELGKKVYTLLSKMKDRKQ